MLFIRLWDIKIANFHLLLSFLKYFRDLENYTLKYTHIKFLLLFKRQPDSVLFICKRNQKNKMFLTDS